MMELMQGYAKEGGTVGVDDPQNWSLNTINFLSETTSVRSAAELKKVRNSFGAFSSADFYSTRF